MEIKFMNIKIFISKLLLFNILLIPFYNLEIMHILRILFFLFIILLVFFDICFNGLIKKDFIYMILFLFVLFLGLLLHSIDVFINEIRYFINYLFYPISLYFIYYLYGRYILLEDFLKYINFSAFFSTVIGLFFYVQNFSFMKLIVDRFSGSYLDPNFYGLHVLIAIIISIWLYETKKEKIYIFLVMFYLAVLLFSLSKTAIILTLFYLVFSSRFSFKRILFFICLLAIVFAIFGDNIFGHFMERFNYAFHLSPLDLKVISEMSGIDYTPGTIFGIPMDAFSNRVGLWVISVNIFLHNIISGVGLGQMLNDYMKFYVDGVIPIPSHSHNTYLQILAELGLVGLLLMYLIYFKIRKINIKILNTIKIFVLIYIFTITAYAMPILYVILGYLSNNGKVKFYAK
jgi:O-antigen ligase